MPAFVDMFPPNSHAQLADALLSGSLGRRVRLRSVQGGACFEYEFIAPGHSRCTLPASASRPGPFDAAAALQANGMAPIRTADGESLVVDLTTAVEAFATFKIACNQLSIFRLQDVFVELMAPPAT